MDRTLGLGSEPVLGIWAISFEPENTRNQGIIYKHFVVQNQYAFFFFNFHTSLLLGGDVGSPPEGDRLGGLPSLLGGSAGATFT